MQLQESNFSRTISNISKAGAYYTDLAHCEKIGKLFNWPDEEVSILEPSAGDGAAVIKVTEGCKQRKIFAVELSREVAENKLKPNEDIFEYLCCDFLDTKISNKVFSFCFANPPYIQSMDDGRMENAFLKRLTNYMSEDAVLTYVINISVATSEEFLKIYLRNYVPLVEYRFEEYEYTKYKQVVFVGRKRKHPMDVDREFLDSYSKRTKESFPVLNDENTEDVKIDVLPSKEEKVVFFTSKEFDEDRAFETLKALEPQKKNLKKLSVEPFSEAQIGRPPTMPNTNILYLLSTLGLGMGKTGCKENRDEHLQRGCARVQESKFIESDQDGNEMEVTQRSTKITVTVLEQDGTFSTLE